MVEPKKRTFNEGACEERSQILDHVQVLRKKVMTVPMTAVSVLDNIEAFIQSRAGRTQARPGGL